jgi:hypothetical protein
MDTLWGIHAELSRAIFVAFLITCLLDRLGPSGYAVQREARKGYRRFSDSGPYGDIDQKKSLLCGGSGNYQKNNCWIVNPRCGGFRQYAPCHHILLLPM